jgi:Putative peptidoglycan binding domain
MITREEYAKLELAKIDRPVTDYNVQSMVIWMVSEGTSAEWNPHATTMPEPGATDFNSVHVKNYPDEATGLKGFADTVLNGFYAPILDCLTRSAVPAETCSVIVNSPWGSKPNPDIVASVLGSWDTYATVPIAGSESIPAPAPAPEPTPAPTPEPTPPTPTEDNVQVPTLQVGDSSAAVKNMQLLLNEQIHSDLAIDGSFGPLTETAVKACQQFWHLNVDGVCGPITWTYLVNF